MLEIFRYCHLNKCIVKFSFEIPDQVTVTVTNSKNNNQYHQLLPWDHITDEKVIDCIDFCIQKTNTMVNSDKRLGTEIIIPIPANRVYDYIAGITFNAIMDSVNLFLATKPTGQSYWMTTQEIKLLIIPEQFHEKCEKFKAVVACNHLEDQPTDLKGIFIYCCDYVTDTEAISMAQHICVVPPQSLS